jgi:hypothetical protein
MPGTNSDAPFAKWMAKVRTALIYNPKPVQMHFHLRMLLQVKDTKAPSSRASFFVKMAGHTFEIPYDTWCATTCSL